MACPLRVWQVWPARNPKEAATTIYANLRSLISQVGLRDDYVESLRISSAQSDPFGAPQNSKLGSCFAPPPRIPQSSVAEKILSAIVPSAAPISTTPNTMSRDSSMGEIVPAPDAVSGYGLSAKAPESRNGLDHQPGAGGITSAAVANVPLLPPQIAVSQGNRAQSGQSQVSCNLQSLTFAQK